jgi:hypothetical protein
VQRNLPQQASTHPALALILLAEFAFHISSFVLRVAAMQTWLCTHTNHTFPEARGFATVTVSAWEQS